MTRTGNPAVGSPVRRRRPGRRLVGALVRAVAAVVVLGTALFGVAWLLTPSVGDAASRVAAQLAAHSEPALQGPVPARVAEALIATENSRFYSTPGIDPVSVLRAPVTLVTGHDPSGATLEQQLAKNLYEQGGSAPVAKLAEAALAVKLDRSWSKQQILRMYLDDGYYGHGYYGLTAAATGYFGVRPADLTWAQASLLAGLVQAPSAYDPLAHPELARARQAHVLDRLVAVGALTRTRADAVAAESWGLRPGA
jgi:penicillin-binding protein 1A